jgi:hypothetical protein
MILGIWIVRANMRPVHYKVGKRRDNETKFQFPCAAPDRLGTRPSNWSGRLGHHLRGGNVHNVAGRIMSDPMRSPFYSGA